MKRLILGAVVALGLVGLADAASAQVWERDCQDNRLVDSIQSRSFACYDFTGTTDSGFLFLDCEDNADVLFWSDTAAAGGVATVRLMSCGSHTPLNGNNCFIVENVTLDGLPATNTEAIYGFQAKWVWIDVIVGAAAGDTPRVLVTCN